MAAISFAERALSQLVQHYVDTRRAIEPVSTRHALVALRTILPNCTLTDRELADLVAAAAIRRRLNISFDGGQDELKL